MTSPTETARDHQAGPQDDQNMLELNRDPAGAIPEGDPQPPALAASGYPGVTALGSAAAQPGLAGRDDASLVGDSVESIVMSLIDIARDREVHEIVAALAGVGTLDRRRLAWLVRADLWGEGLFPSALRAAVVQGKVRRTGKDLYALVPGTPGPGDG